MEPILSWAILLAVIVVGVAEGIRKMNEVRK